MMPFSDALAYYGYNVVVVDAASQYVDKEAVRKLQESERKKEKVKAMMLLDCYSTK